MTPIYENTETLVVSVFFASDGHFHSYADFVDVQCLHEAVFYV